MPMHGRLQSQLAAFCRSSQGWCREEHPAGLPVPHHRTGGGPPLEASHTGTGPLSVPRTAGAEAALPMETEVWEATIGAKH